MTMTKEQLKVIYLILGYLLEDHTNGRYSNRGPRYPDDTLRFEYEGNTTNIGIRFTIEWISKYYQFPKFKKYCCKNVHMTDSPHLKNRLKQLRFYYMDRLNQDYKTVKCEKIIV